MNPMHPIKSKLTALLVGVACLGLGVLFASTLDWTPTTQATQTNHSSSADHASLRSLSNSFTAIAEEVTPAVVYVTGQRLIQRGDLPFDFGPFEDFFERSPHQDSDQPLRRPSGGSGVIVRADGYIVTNNHVVENMEGLQVILNDRRTFDAEIVGRDPSTDVAVLKIDSSDLPVAQLAADGEVQVGEWVLALGNPLGLQFTMTAGIVSAMGRANLNIINRGENPYAIEDFIQTDAAINPGNSGGPLVNIDGHVIGINTAIASQTGRYMGYGFAIPITIVRNVMDQLIENGSVERAVLGVSIQAVTPLDQEALGLQTADGVLIADFDSRVADNPARKAGVQPRDVVMAVDGQPVSTPSQLQQQIAFHKPGDKVELTVWRDGRERKIEVTLGERPAPPESVTQFVNQDRGELESALGMEVEGLTGGLRSNLAERGQISAADIPQGVVVRSVEPIGPAADANIPPNSVITQVGDHQVRTVEEYRQAVESLQPGSVVYFRIVRPGGSGQEFRALRVPR
jgi:serine protease Do